MKKKGRILGKVVYILNVLAVLALLISCVYFYFGSSIFRVFSLFGLLVPFLFILNILFVIYWLLKRKRRFLLSLVVLIVAFMTFGAFYKVGNGSNDKAGEGLKIMTYNTLGFNINGWIDKPDVGDRIIELIEKEDPDILCIQEHSRRRRKQLVQYPYRSETPHSQGKSAQAVFSKYPIIENGSLDLPNTANNIIYADILYNKDTIRVYNLHLQSFHIVPSSKYFIEEESDKHYRRLIRTFAKQQEQVEILDAHRKLNSFKTIVCGDFNNTQFSHVYRNAKRGLNDSFLENGNGFGKTYNLFGFPLRIDYILTDPAFEVVSHKNFDEKLSDHYPVMATLRLKK